MDTLNKIYVQLNSIASINNVSLTQLDSLRFKIVLFGDLMSTYFQLGKIESSLKECCEENGYVLKTILGDSQDAVFEIKPINE